MKNLKAIKDHNEKFAEGVETFKMGLNQFSDYVKTIL
jgi:hypothetical protein